MSPKKLTLSDARSRCPVACTLDIIGDKWTLLIIRDLKRGRHRFNAFSESDEKMPTNLLSERLERLIEYRLVEKAPLVEGGKRMGYYLTEKGQSLGRILSIVADWGLEHIDDTELAAEIQALRNGSS